MGGQKIESGSKASGLEAVATTFSKKYIFVYK